MLIAHHLPQFHQIPENDEWWGKGFTDWVNVRNARALFQGHQQPRTPHPSLGEYDLSQIDGLLQQWHLARKFGVDGFCYYHYWFDGRVLLQKPIELARNWSGPEKLPYCLCWANEPWTRAWDGADREVLMPQTYGGEISWERHFTYLQPFFEDEKYILWNGRPLFLIYRAAAIPQVEEMIACWRALAKERLNVDLAIVQMKTGFGWDEARSTTYDASLCFEPMLSLRSETFTAKLADLMNNAVRASRIWRRPYTFDYDRCWRQILAKNYGPKLWPGAFVDWDNTPRKGARGHICKGGSPEKFGARMKDLIRLARASSAPFIFVNAWNEWAEGNFLEPESRLGFSYLEKLFSAK